MGVAVLHLQDITIKYLYNMIQLAYDFTKFVDKKYMMVIWLSDDNSYYQKY